MALMILVKDIVLADVPKASFTNDIKQKALRQTRTDLPNEFFDMIKERLNIELRHVPTHGEPDDGEWWGEGEWLTNMAKEF